MKRKNVSGCGLPDVEIVSNVVHLQQCADRRVLTLSMASPFLNVFVAVFVCLFDFVVFSLKL